ncbi:MAG: ComF family protein [Parahaliea sp.]
MPEPVCRRLLNGLFPQYCLYCGLPSRRALPLCQPCQRDLPRNRHGCQRCALPLPPGPPGRLCGACLSEPPPMDGCVAPYLYGPELALIVRRWKYRPEYRLGASAIQLWLAAAPALPEVDALLYVPLHWRKRLRRGFNQADQLCRGLQRGHPALRHLPLLSRLLVRQRATTAQAGLDARARARNLRSAFTLRGHCDNLRIAVVDDVMTTGATAHAIARCLKAGGAREVHLWCLARTPLPND